MESKNIITFYNEVTSLYELDQIGEKLEKMIKKKKGNF